MAVTNTLAYDDMATIMVEIFSVLTQHHISFYLLRKDPQYPMPCPPLPSIKSEIAICHTGIEQLLREGHL